MITIWIFKNDSVKNVLTKTLWEFAEWYRAKVANDEVDKWYEHSSRKFEMHMKNGIRYIIEENR